MAPRARTPAIRQSFALLHSTDAECYWTHPDARHPDPGIIQKAHLHGRYGVPFFSLLDHVGPHATLPGLCRWVVCPRNRGFCGCHLSRRSEARVGEAYRSAPAWTAWPLAAREHASDVLVSMWSPMEHIGALMHAVVARIATIPNSPRSMCLSSRCDMVLVGSVSSQDTR